MLFKKNYLLTVMMTDDSCSYSVVIKKRYVDVHKLIAELCEVREVKEKEKKEEEQLKIILTITQFPKPKII